MRRTRWGRPLLVHLSVFLGKGNVAGEPRVGGEGWKRGKRERGKFKWMQYSLDWIRPSHFTPVCLDARELNVSDSRRRGSGGLDTQRAEPSRAFHSPKGRVEPGNKQLKYSQVLFSCNHFCRKPIISGRLRLRSSRGTAGRRQDSEHQRPDPSTLCDQSQILHTSSGLNTARNHTDSSSAGARLRRATWGRCESPERDFN